MSSRRPRTLRRALTLIELVLATAVTSVLVVGLVASIMLATRSVETTATITTTGAAADRGLAGEIARDLHFATSFTTRTATEVEFDVPDRDGDGSGERIRYFWEGTPGGPSGPVKREVNAHLGHPAVTLADDVAHFDLDYDHRTIIGVPPPVPEAAGTPLLMVVVDAAALTAQETARQALLETWGYAVTPMSASAPLDDFTAAAAAAEVAYVVQQGGAQTLGTKLTDATIGIVNEEVQLRQSLGFAKNADYPTPKTTIEILDVDHEITSPFALGDLVIFSSVAEVVGVSNGLPSGFVSLAYTDASPGSKSHGLAAIEVGGGTYDGGVAAGRRVQLPWGGIGFDIGQLNDDGRLIMARAVAWAADEGGGPAGPATFGYDTVLGTPVSNVRRKQIATKATLGAPGTIESITAYIGNGGKARYAIYTDNGGEPDALIVESAEVTPPGGTDWLTIPVPSVGLSAGDYWLALSFDGNAQTYYQQSGGETRYVDHRATRSGFLDDWGTSAESYAITMSIYATYVPD